MRGFLVLPWLMMACTGGAPDGSGGSAAPAASVETPHGTFTIVAVGPAGEEPRGLQVRLPVDAFPPAAVGGAAPDGTTLVLEPAIDGQLDVLAPNLLSFKPAAGFVAGTRYTATLTAIGGKPPGAEPVSLGFDVPAFGLVRAHAAAVDIAKGTAAVDLVFTAPVDAATVGARLAVEGGPVIAGVGPGPRPETVRVSLRAVVDGAQVRFRVSEGVRAADPADGTAPSGEAAVGLAGGAAVELRAVMVRDGASGRYIEVACNDAAAGGERWWWDEEIYESHWVSTRCLPTEAEALSRIHLDPAVDFTVSEGPVGFRIFGDFPRGPLSVRFDAGLRTVDGGVLAAADERQFDVGPRKSRLSLVSKGRYLPRAAWKHLPIEHVNVERVEVVVRHVPEQNLAFWLSGEEPLDARTSDIVFRKELDLVGVADTPTTTWLDAGALLPQVQRGVYEVRVQAIGGGSVADTARFLLTDMHLVAKRVPGSAEGPPAVQVWALDAHTARPLAGVDLKLIRPSGSALSRCRTDGGGACVLPVHTDIPDTIPALGIIASRGDDLTYLAFADVRLHPEGDVSGKPSLTEDGNAVPWSAAAWLDRGVYRPGETAHFSAVLRDASGSAPSTPTPLVVVLTDARGREVRRKVLPTSPTGLISAELPFADFAPTGRWRVGVELGGQRLAESAFNVEEFVPERMAVTATGTPGGVGAATPVPVSVEARWLFGGSASGSAVELACRLEASPFQPPGAKGWQFGAADLGDGSASSLSLGTVSGVLGEDGRAALSCPAADQRGAWLGSAQMVADVAVFEGESGRATRARVKTPVHPAARYIGLRAGRTRLNAGESTTVEGRVVGWDGAALPVGEGVKAELFRLENEIGWWWDEGEQGRRLLRRFREGAVPVRAAGEGFAVDLRATADAAGWLLVVSAPDGARTELFVEGGDRRWWWGAREDRTPRPGRATPLALEVPERVEVGAEVVARTTAPWPGQVLWTVESKGILESRWEAVDEAGPISFSFDVDTFEPNVYVSAFLVKDPHLESPDAWLPERAHGVASVAVDPKAHRLALEINAPTELRPDSTLELRLQAKGAKGPTQATVAVVDEGVLSLTRFATPDPLADLYARRALLVETYETLGWSVLSRPPAPGSRTGGDAEGGAMGRVQSVKPVSLWSGVVDFAADGTATVSLAVPSYRGKLRVMAVAVTPTQVGAAEASVLVKEPIQVQTTLPRFLVEGDRATLPVFVSNLSGKRQVVAVRIGTEDLGSVPDSVAPPVLDTVGETRREITLADGASETVLFEITARRAPGAARIEVVAEAGSLRSRESLELPVASPLPEDRRSLRVPLGAEPVDIDALLAGEGWVRGSDRTVAWVTVNPYADAFGHLNYLIHYPYGCVEQTTSGTRPLLYAGRLLQAVDPTAPEAQSIDSMVQAGIDRIFSMQTPGGGFGYWPGDDTPSAWGTAYALHMLLDAKEAGYSLPESDLAEALGWLERSVGEGNGDAHSAPYAHYVLARAGKGQVARISAALSAVDASAGGQSDESRRLLQAALWLSGDRRHEKALRALPVGTLAETGRETRWSWYSALRGRALALALYTDLFGADTGAAPAADALADALRRSPSWGYTTQELAWALTALGKRVQKLADQAPAAELRAGSTVLRPMREEGERAWSLAAATARSDISLRAPTGGAAAWLVLTTHGVRAVDDGPGGVGLRLSREYLAADGSALDAADVPLGKPLFIRTTLVNVSGDSQANLALVDRLPAGWELESPRLEGDARPDWVDPDALWSVDHMNLRDDRIEVFGSLDAGQTVSVVVSARAVTAGTFTAPPARAEAMYDPTIGARTEARAVGVRGPWPTGNF